MPRSVTDSSVRLRRGRVPHPRPREFRGRRGSRQEGQGLQDRRSRRGDRAPAVSVVTRARPGQNDMCHAGGYQERGIVGRHGFMAEYYVESPQWLNKIPKDTAEIGVLLEPMSVVEKGIDHAFLLQRRLDWKPRTGVVLGGGPIGLLAAAVMRARGLDTHVIGRELDTDRARAAGEEDGRHISLRGRQDAVRREEGDAADRHRGRSHRSRGRGVRRHAGSRHATACCACSA